MRDGEEAVRQAARPARGTGIVDDRDPVTRARELHEP